jgi:eukaryotic-like serine/threonine-protein kinase
MSRGRDQDRLASETRDDKEQSTQIEGPHSAGKVMHRDKLPVPGSGEATAALRRRPLTGESSAAEALGPDSMGRRYDDLGEISRGGMGSIRHVFHKRLGRFEAMKVLDPRIAEGSALATRFLEEARIMGQLDHPNIVPVYDLGLSASGSPSFFTMKLVRGKTFGSSLADLGDERLQSPNLERALESLIKVCDAVSFAHSRGVIHCDLKPSNIMVGSHGQVYVMDWGIALYRELPADQPAELLSGPMPGTLMGTPSYMAPEQTTGAMDTIDVRTDVYGIGGILYRILTGKPPHMGDSAEETMAEARAGIVRPPEGISKSQKLHVELCRIAMKALAVEQSARYQSVEELRHDLEMFLRGDGWLPTQVFKAGDVLIHEGEIAKLAYIIVNGHCEVYKTVEGKKVSLRFMAAGEVFGEAGIFTSERRTASVAARSDVTVKVVTRELLEMEFARSTWMAALVRSLASRFRELDAELMELRERVKGKP